MALLDKIKDWLCWQCCTVCGRIVPISEAKGWPTAVYVPGVENQICPDCYRRWKAHGQEIAA